MRIQTNILGCLATTILLLGGLRQVSAGEPVPAAGGSLFSPSAFPSLGVLSVSGGGEVIFDTGTATTAPTVSGVANGAGALGVSKSGQVQVAVFTFDSIQIADGAGIRVTGDRGLVLLSKGAVTVDAKIDLSGGNGSKGKGSPVGPGGPGGEGGEFGKTFNSAPPPADGGDGGPSMKDNGRPGFGYGAGFNRRAKGGAAGGGGAYGGAGGATSEASKLMGPNPPAPMPGGVVYGDPELADLFGGSGGAGGSNDRGRDNGSGGGGGGAFSLVSTKSIALGPKAQILAMGGAGGVDKIGGGGGSGGAILLAAPALQISPGALLDVSGGAGGDGGPVVLEDIAKGDGRRNTGSGGGGGGGRIAIYSPVDIGKPGKNRPEDAPPEQFKTAGGKGGTGAVDGGSGTIYDGSFPSIR